MYDDCWTKVEETKVKTMVWAVDQFAPSIVRIDSQRICTVFETRNGRRTCTFNITGSNAKVLPIRTCDFDINFGAFAHNASYGQFCHDS